MERVKELLCKYISDAEIQKLFTTLEEKHRASVLVNEYFIKIGNNKKELFFNNLINEISLYKNNKNNENLPRMIDSFVDDSIAVIVLEKIEGKTIGTERNKFNLYLNKDARLRIIESVLKIPNIDIKNSIANDYSRLEKLNKYLDASKAYLSKKVINKVDSYKDNIVYEKYDRVISHGDLISTNIMINNNQVYFIDWEFISYKPKYFDLVYFLLFSKTNNCLDILYDCNLKIDINEALKDAIILCLKEIQNNAKLYGKIDKNIVDKNINRWKKELSIILRRFAL